jgi:hypothetical protein
LSHCVIFYQPGDVPSQEPDARFTMSESILHEAENNSNVRLEHLSRSTFLSQ